jgi:hypothetical protein
MRGIVGASFVVLLVGMLVGFGASRLSEPPSSPPIYGVTRFLEGMGSWDGHEVWGSYAPDYQSILENEGESEWTTMRLYDDRRKRGAVIDAVIEIGGYQTETAGYFVYLTRSHVKDGEPTEVVWIFRTDEVGLIENVEARLVSGS